MRVSVSRSARLTPALLVGLAHLSALALPARPAEAQDPANTRMLQDPALSQTRLEAPNASYANLSPSGERLAYTPLPPAMAQWKHYRGGRASRIWLPDRGEGTVVEIPQPEGRSNDLAPLWVGRRVYFLSDRKGTIEEVLRQLEASPPVEPERPPFPVRVRR